MLEFRDLLRALIRDRMTTQEAWGETVGLNQKAVSEYVLGKKDPPLEDVDRWADSFSLTGDERLAFKRSALYAHTPREVRDEVSQLRKDNAELQERVNRLSLAVADLIEKRSSE